MKYSKQDAKLLEAKFKYANVLLGLSMLHNADKDEREHKASEGVVNEGQPSVQDTIRKISQAVAPVLIPMIDHLSGLTDDEFVETSARGEDG